MLKLKCFSSDGVKVSSIGSDESGPTTPCERLDVDDRLAAAAAPPAKDDFSKLKAKGRCSVLTMLQRLARALPDEQRAEVVPRAVERDAGLDDGADEEEGHVDLELGTWKRQCDSWSATSSGVKWKTISNLRPARMVPLRVWQRKGARRAPRPRATSSSPAPRRTRTSCWSG